ncbi:MAG TPA: CDP-diacylglycerol--glycerol-3-phosphate 3-phosphatidyltransferase [Candidatus Cloacimonadota bacterium]|nr:CDP-diacylglycerol--glycerol-3-phosphate 3-phosphatidyltransferase [Candidatus Cloacimonadota bacterium]
MTVHKNLPNLITIFRIILVPVFGYFIFMPSKPQGIWWALVIFVIASISDYFDGYLARKYNLVTAFGKIMDPLADKILVLVAMVSLTFVPMHWLNPIILIIIALREIAVTILRDYHAKRNHVIAANIWGKLKTVTQMVGIVAALLIYALVREEVSEGTLLGIQIYFWIVALITILSGLNYFFIKHE